MAYFKNVNIECLGDYNKQLYQVIEKFKNIISGYAIENTFDKSVNIKICAVKDKDYNIILGIGSYPKIDKVFVFIKLISFRRTIR